MTTSAPPPLSHTSVELETCFEERQLDVCPLLSHVADIEDVVGQVDSVVSVGSAVSYTGSGLTLLFARSRHSICW